MSKDNKNWKDYLDSNGLVIQKNGDGGDSLNRTSAVGLLQYLTCTPVLSALVISEQLSDGNGRYRRSNHPNKWYSNYNRTSRDQLTPLVILQGYLRPDWLALIFKEHAKRLWLFAYNTRRNFQYPTLEEHQRLSTPDVKWDYSWKLPDITGPEFWALYVRGFNKTWSYPLLWIFDIHTLLGALVLRYQKENDVLNHALVLEYSKVRMDTWWMKLARKLTPRSLLQPRLDAFFGVEQEPPINELYSKLP